MTRELDEARDGVAVLWSCPVHLREQPLQWVGLIGVYFHVAADASGLSASLFENFVHGAQAFAPLLFVDLGFLTAIGLCCHRRSGSGSWKAALMHRLLRVEWDAIAGVLAAIAAIVLHFLHVIDTEVLSMITLVLIAAMFLRLLRSEHGQRRIADGVDRGERLLGQLARSAKPPDVLVIGPRDLRQVSTQFSRGAKGEMVWFNVCLSMFERQSLFDALLLPAIENPSVTAVTFVLDERQRPKWEREVWPKVVACDGGGKVAEPVWSSLPEDVSFILADTLAGGTTECLLSFWGEPFMSRRVGRDVPRYIFHVTGHSELIERLVEMAREHRLSG